MSYAGTVGQMVWGSPSTQATPVSTPTQDNTQSIQQISVADPYLYGLQDGMTQQDNGNGTFGILYNGQSLGTGYAGVRDAYNTLALQNAQKQTTEGTGYWSNPLLQSMQAMWSGFGDMGLGPAINDADLTEEQRQAILQSQGIESGYWQQQQNMPTRFKSQDELNTALQSYIQGQDFHNDIGNWEALGQAVNGGVASNTVVGGRGEYSANPINGLGETSLLPANGVDEVISGTNALYGSTPVFEKDSSGNYRLAGYRTDLLPGSDEDQSVTENKINNEQFGSFVTHDDSSRAYATNNWRELDADSVAKNAVMGADGKAFIPLENADKLKWTNKDSSQYQEKGGGGSFFGAVFDFLDPILDDIDPLHDWNQNNVTKALGYDSQKQTFETVAPIVLAIVASALTAGAASGAVGAAGGAAAEGAAAGAAAGTASGVAGGAAAGMTTGQMVGWGLAGANAANSVSKGDYLGAVTGLLGTGLSSGAFNSVLADIGSGAKDIATAAGISSDTQGAISQVAKGLMSGDLKAMTAGTIDLGSFANKAIGGAVSSAVKNAALAGASGAELQDVMKTALISSMASLVGSSAKEFTGSGVAGSVAGTAAGIAGNGLLNSDQASSGGTKPVTTTNEQSAAPQQIVSTNKYAGSVGKMIWS